MLNKFIFWLFMVPFPAWGMYEERPDLTPHTDKINGISIGFHTMNHNDPDYIYAIAIITSEHKVKFERVHITYQPTPTQTLRIIQPEGIYPTDNNIVVNFKLPRR